MKRHILSLFFILLLIFSVSAQHNGWRPREMELKIPITNTHDAARLYDLKLDSEMGAGFARVYATPDEFELIKASGLTYEISIADLNAHYANYWERDVPVGYYTWEQVRDIADSLAANFPAICKKYTYGFSAGNHELGALKISDNVNKDEDEAEILFDGGIHGDEVGGSQNVITFARKLCLSYGIDPYLTSLVNGREIWLYYCVNPDGRINMSRYNGNGVDINRDFGYMWNGEGNSTSGFSQPESKALRDCVYENQFVVYTNYHSGTEYLSYPWSYRASNAPDKPSINHLAGIYASSSGYLSLQYGQGYTGMYPINGSTKDFNYGSLGSVAWSMEISLDKQPPQNQIGYYYALNEPAMLAVTEYAGYGLEGIITDAKTGFPVRAAIFLGNNYPVYSDDSVGDYHKYVIPGTYSLKVVANGYQTKTISNVVVSGLSSAVTDIQLQQLPGQFAYKVVSCYIPGNNFYDEGYTAACLGSADMVNYSLGKGGNIVLDMQYPIINGEGDDIIVHEGDATPEGYTVYASNSKDGPWTWIGDGIGTTNFDLSPANVPDARYLRILDDNNGTAGISDAGFDLDAVEALFPYEPDSMGTLSGIIYDYATGLGLEGARVSMGTHSTISGINGDFVLPVSAGVSIIVCAGKNLYSTECDTLTIHGGQTIYHNFSLNTNVAVGNSKYYKSDVSAEPNPFTSQTFIKIKTDRNSRTRIDLFNMAGKLVANLLDADLYAGEHDLMWCGTDNKGNLLPGGIYFCRISMEDFCNSLKIVLIR
jgi:hypothetical protein